MIMAATTTFWLAQGKMGVMGSEPRQALLFESVLEYVSLILGWTQEHKNHREDAMVYPGSGRYSRAPKIRGYNRVYRM